MAASLGEIMNWIEANPTLSVGIIGFIGVIGTLFINAGLARRQRREELRHERQTLRTALLEELKIHLGALEQEVGEVEKTGSIFVPTDPMDDTYRAFIPRLGLLSQEEVQKVMVAYLSLRTYNAKLFLIGVPPHTGNRHVQVPEGNSSMLSGMKESLILPAGEAIQALEAAVD